MADEPELYIDNPGGNWLQEKLEKAQKDYQTAPLESYRRKTGSSDITGYFKTPLDLPPDLLKGIPGALGEEAFRESSVKLENLQKSIQERGYEPSPILVHVREDGQPFILEGNHRVAEALLSKRSTIPVELRYLRGGETADGLLSPQKVKDFYSKRLGSRPPDQSNLPAAIDAAAEASRLALPPDDETRPKGKGQMFRGIGSLMRGRILPLVRAAQMGYELLPEDKQVAGKVLDYLQNTPTHEFFGMDKPGIEYFKDLLGISKPGSEGGIITLPESLYQDLYHGTPNVWDPEWVDDVYYPEGRPRSDSEVRLTGEGFAAITGGFYAGEASGTGYRYADILAREHGTVPNVYKGEIRKDILNNQFIDYNLPVNEQPLKVQEVFKDLGYETKTPGKLAGADILFRMRRELGEDVVEDELRKRGIVGVRFLDQLSRNDQNLYQGKSLVKKDGKALSLNQDWERDGRNVLKYLVDNKMDVAEFVREQRQVYRDKGKISRFLGNAKQREKFLGILEGTTVKKTPLTRNMVIWDQTLLNQIGKTIKKELAHGGFVVRPLYDS